ncbi:replication initiation protein [Sphaerisporangium krabiense]|uniref:Replication initiation protein n=1 Tax=Sphaerisporangium krabiense TaxID=763782 RepID=A0A7W8Z8X2_9ACTN|nr:replication initiator [Sphaerisporangium krabiense]MBB5629501.1 hypothetical protein [Sphaerisporangium krabiense]GII65648.1 replication initiation protein [Sphaerisporangium krabiense]
MSAPAPLADLVGPVIRDLARRSGKDLTRWLDQVARLGGCAEPVRLSGETATIDAGTGQILDHYSTIGEPHGQLLVRCGNRRASRCPSCAETYRRDTYHLIRAGLLGGSKDVPATVRTHPRVLATLTAPSFGPVHRGPDKSGKPVTCRPRRTGPACWKNHAPGDPAIGQPLDPASYDYIGHVLWNAHAGDLWRRFTIYLRRHLATATGLTHAAFNRCARVSFAKVAEYQARGVVHFHAVIRIDGRTDDPADVIPPPPWATVELLTDAIHTAARASTLDAPHLGQETTELVWGEQIDVKPIDLGELDDQAGELNEQKVAGYIAKYATKAAESSGTLDRRIRPCDLPRLEKLDVTDHAARLIRTAWNLGDLDVHPRLLPLKLRKWAHMLGFRGHFSTKSRAYSTTLGRLRQARIDYRTNRRTGPHSDETTLVVAHWRYAGQGYTAGESVLATGLSGSRNVSAHEGKEASNVHPRDDFQ